MPKRSASDKNQPAFDLKAERESRGLTQAEVARLLHSAQASIARWESDGRLPTIHREYWKLYWQVNKQKKVKVVRSRASKQENENASA